MISSLAWASLQKTPFSHVPNNQQVQLLPVDDKQTSISQFTKLSIALLLNLGLLSHRQNKLPGIPALLNHSVADHDGKAWYLVAHLSLTKKSNNGAAGYHFLRPNKRVSFGWGRDCYRNFSSIVTYLIKTCYNIVCWYWNSTPLFRKHC